MVMRNVDVSRVRTLPLFADTSVETFRDILGGSFLQRFPSGTTLLMEGDPVDFLYVLLDGSVELGGTWNDKETSLAIIKPVSTFILAAVVLDTESLMSAVTLDRSEILMISGDALRRTMQSDASFGFRVSQELSGCYRGLVRTIKNQKLRGGAERLANYLLTLKVQHGGGPTITLPHEKRVLASLLGMTPENLSRAFAALTEYGIEINGPKVTITRPVVLERLAKPTPLIDAHLPPSEGLYGDAERERWVRAA